MTITNDVSASAQLAICHREMCQANVVLLLVPIGAISAGTHRERVSGKRCSRREESVEQVKTANKFINHRNSKIRE